MSALSLLSLAVLLPQAFEEPVGVTKSEVDVTSTPLAATSETVPDAWGPRIRLRAEDGWFSVPIHATLMPDGRVHFMGYERDLEDPSVPSDQRKATFMIDPLPLGSTAPTDHTVTPLTSVLDANNLFILPYFIDDTLFCAGNTLMADGQLFTAGGTRGVFDVTTSDVFTFGLPYATRFDGTNWTRIPNEMVGLGASGLNNRWYTTPTRLPDGRILVTSGYDVVLPNTSLNLSAELYDPATDSFTLFSDLTDVPMEVFNGDYTHAFVLPEPVGQFDMVMFGQAGTPVLASTSGPASWAPLAIPRPGTLAGQAPNSEASSTLLPIRVEDGEWGYSNGSVMMTSGQTGTSHARKVDVFDTQALAWKQRVDLGVSRSHPSTVLLPDGRVLVVAGHNSSGSPDLRRNAYFDPRNPRGTKLGASFNGEVRGYHTVAVLLPDGRVLIGGGRDLITSTGPDEKSDMRYYSPSYLLKPNRPKILSAPDGIRLGKEFLIQTNKRVSEVVLLALGSMTHSIDMNQRYVQLDKLQSIKLPTGHVHSIAAPPNGQIAPPGYYMLFALDNRRVPSEAVIVQVK